MNEVVTSGKSSDSFLGLWLPGDGDFVFLSLYLYLLLVPPSEGEMEKVSVLDSFQIMEREAKVLESSGSRVVEDVFEPDRDPVQKNEGIAGEGFEVSKDQ